MLKVCKNLPICGFHFHYRGSYGSILWEESLRTSRRHSTTLTPGCGTSTSEMVDSDLVFLVYERQYSHQRWSSGEQ